MRNIYFDVLDTARTSSGGPRKLDPARAEECISLGKAELQLAVLVGRLRPVFPQTAGFDSAALLQYADPNNSDRESFLWLVRNRYIRIARRDQKSVLEAARAAFKDRRYRLGYGLSAWPELNGDRPEVEKSAVVEALDDKISSRLPHNVEDRVDALFALSAAASEADKLHGSLKESPRGDQLRERIQSAARAAEPFDQTVAAFLHRCTQLPDPNRRGAIDEFLNTEESLGLVPHEVREITDGCFNAVAANCVGDHTPVLTFSPSYPMAQAIMQSANPGSVRVDVFHGEIKEPLPEDYKNLEPLSWANVKEFVQKHGELDFNERRREMARLIAQIIVHGVPRYAIDWRNVCIGLLAGTASGAVTYKAAGAEPTRRKFLLTAASFFAGGFGAVATSGLRVREDRREEFDHIYYHWKGLLLG